MNKLTISPLGRTIDVQSGTSLLNAIRAAGIEIPSPCNGQHLCGKCKVRLADDGTTDHGPQEQLTADELASGLRLACQMTVDGDMHITLPDGYSQDTRILEGHRIEQARIAPAATIEGHQGTHRLHYRQRLPVALDQWPTDGSPKGIAIDIGTTTLVATLMDLQTGAELATASAVNPQQAFGHDVMTRIQHASTEAGLNQLTQLISDAMNALIQKTCRTSATRIHEIVDGVVGGNTTMLQIIAGIDPSPLGVLPFRVDMQSGRTYSANRFALNVNPQARIYIPPVAHAFVGSDISAGLLSIDFFKQEAPVLFIDIGTNGEMALSAHEKWMVTSTAAGPAFEGMGIRHGMRASSGAIETVWTNGDFLNLRTIDDAPAKGICGSGIMDIMACLIRHKAVEPGGRLKDPAKSQTNGPLPDRYESTGGKAAIRLTDTVSFTQKDIRQFQLAKSAIQTGIDMLLEAAGVKPDQLSKIVIAGAFGYHIREESLRCIGIVPKDFAGEVAFAGNTCRTGCALMLTDAASRNFLEDCMARVSHLAIAESADFQSRFIENLSVGG